MEYNLMEQKTLDLLGRTDFKAIKKDELVSITSMLCNMRPEVALEAIKQFPELAKLIQTSLKEYKESIDRIVESDDASIQRFYDSADKVIANTEISREQFSKIVENLQSDYNRYYDNATSEKERADIREKQMELIKLSAENEKAVREHQEKTLNEIDRKDAEKRQFNWKFIGAASTVLALAIGIGAATLGGKIEFKLPKKQQ